MKRSTQAYAQLLTEELKAHAAHDPATNAQYFFKEKIKTYGVKTPVVNTIAKEHIKVFKKEGWTKPELFGLCDLLWQTGFIEDASLAAAFAFSRKKEFEPGDFKQFEAWIKHYVNNWASCDKFCNHTVGSFLQRYPGFLPKLFRWTKSKNRWQRRAAAVSLIVPAKQGLFLDTILQVATNLLHDPDDLVQKGYGWMLKEAAQPHEDAVFDFILQHKQTMPRTALRYAIEKMPVALQREAMER